MMALGKAPCPVTSALPYSFSVPILPTRMLTRKKNGVAAGLNTLRGVIGP